MKIIVYSANIDNYDYFYHPSFNDKDVKYILFTDNKYFKSKVWQVVNINNFNVENLDNRRKARFFKINPHLTLPEHDVSIWIDHCMQSKIYDANKFLNQINFDSNKDIMLYRHSVRNCIYDEAKVCIEKNLDKEEVIKNQIQKYKEKSFPQKYGLYETGLMIRRNNEKIINFNNAWWEEIINGSGRDQLSQSYVSWSLDVRIDPISIGKNVYDNPFLNKKEKHTKTFTK